MVVTRAIIGAAVAAALSFPAIAELTGEVVAVADGDTLTVLDNSSTGGA